MRGKTAKKLRRMARQFSNFQIPGQKVKSTETIYQELKTVHKSKNKK